METTLGQVLALRRLGLRRVAGADDPGRAVRWVAVSELRDPTPYLEGGELLLTTGMNLPASGRAELDAYVARLADRGVTALGLAVGLTHSEVPTDLLAAADAHDLTLLEVPPPTPFIAVTRAVADLVAQAERDAVQRSLDAQRRLTRSATRADAAPAVVRDLGRLLGGWALVVDSRATPVHASSPSAAQHAAAVAEEVTRLRPQGLRATSSVPLGSFSLEVYPLGTSGRPRWYLAVGVPGGSDRAARSGIAAAVSLLSLVLERRGPDDDLPRRLRQEAVRRLLVGDAATAEALLPLLGVPPLPDRVLVVAVERVDGGAPDDETDDVPALLASVDGLLVAVTTREDVEEVLAALAGPGVRVALSRPVPRAEVAGALGEARRALRGRSGGQVVRCEDLARQGVGGLVDAGAAREWATAVLAPLREYDEAASVDLVGSLRTYLAHHGQWHPAAAELGVHRHTLRHRMRRVEELLEVSLDSPQVRMDLWFALQQPG